MAPMPAAGRGLAQPTWLRWSCLLAAAGNRGRASEQAHEDGRREAAAASTEVERRGRGRAEACGRDGGGAGEAAALGRRGGGRGEIREEKGCREGGKAVGGVTGVVELCSGRSIGEGRREGSAPLSPCEWRRQEENEGEKGSRGGASSERKEMGSSIAAALEGVEGERLGWPSRLGLGRG